MTCIGKYTCGKCHQWLMENSKMSDPKYCEECGDELTDGEDGICDNCCYGEDEEDEEDYFREDDE
jgi:hypothetical protein